MVGHPWFFVSFIASYGQMEPVVQRWFTVLFLWGVVLRCIEHFPATHFAYCIAFACAIQWWPPIHAKITQRVPHQPIHQLWGTSRVNNSFHCTLPKHEKKVDQMGAPRILKRFNEILIGSTLCSQTWVAGKSLNEMESCPASHGWWLEGRWVIPWIGAGIISLCHDEIMMTDVTWNHELSWMVNHGIPKDDKWLVETDGHGV